MLKTTQDYKVALSLVKRGQYLDVLDRFKGFLAQNRNVFPDLMILLYKRATSHMEDKDLLVLIAELYIHQGMYKEAVVELECLFEIDIDYVQTYYLLGKIYNKTKHKDKIQDIFELAFEQGVLESTVLDLLPKIYEEQNNKEKSVELYEKLCCRFPKNVNYLKILAALYVCVKRLEEALDVYERIIDVDSSETEEIAFRSEDVIEMIPDYVKGRELLVRMYLKIYELDQALAHIDYLFKLSQRQVDLASQSLSIELYKKALDLYPEVEPIILALGYVLIEIKQYTEGISYLRRIFDKNQEKGSDFIDSLEGILKKIPEQVMALSFLSDIYFHQKNYSKVCDYMLRLVELSPESCDWAETRITQILEMEDSLKERTTLILARYFFYKGAYSRSIENCELLYGSQYDRDVRYLRALMAQEEGAYKESKRLLVSIFKHEKNDWNMFVRIGDIHQNLVEQENNRLYSDEWESDAEKIIAEGLSLLRRGDLFKALEKFQAITAVSEGRVKAQLLIGRCFIEMGRFDLAIRQIERMLEHLKNVDQRTLNVLKYYLGISYVHIGDIRKAVISLEHILEQDINFPHVRRDLDWVKTQGVYESKGKLLSGCLWNLGENIVVMVVPDAQRSIETKKKKKPFQSVGFAYSQNNQAVDFMIGKHLKAAEDELEVAIQLEPDFTILYCNLALLCLLKKDYKAALDYLETAESYDLDLDGIYLNRGLIYLCQKNYDLAKFSFQKALMLNPNNYLANLNLGDAYYFEENIEQAIIYWKKASKVGMLFYYIKRRLEHFLPESLSFDFWLNDFSLALDNVMGDLSRETVDKGLEESVFND